MALPTRVFYVRISDDKQEVARQIDGLRQLAESKGDKLPDHVWQAVLDKRPVAADSPLVWDYGSRDQPERRPHFQRIIARVESQAAADPRRLAEVCIYELDRFGVEGVDEWFHYRWLFHKHGGRIISALKGDLTAKDDVRTIIETLFEAMNSRAEQKKIGGRVAYQSALLAQQGQFMGRLPRYGYDKGCFTGERLVWRLHYLAPTHRVQIFATDDNQQALLIKGARVETFIGKDNTPRKAKEQTYRLIPSTDAKRVEGAKFLFRTFRNLAPAITAVELSRLMSEQGFTSFGGSVIDGENLLAMLEDSTYCGRLSYGKRSVARHKRATKSVEDDNLTVEDVPEHEKGKPVFRPFAEHIQADDNLHEGLVEADEFEAVQALLTAYRAKCGKVRREYGPRRHEGWLKPILYCSGCGRQMTASKVHSTQGYQCILYRQKYGRPGDSRFVCSAGLNWIRHDELYPAMIRFLDNVEDGLRRSIELGAIERMEAEVKRHEEAAKAGSHAGCRDYLTSIFEALELDGGPLAESILRLRACTDPAEQLAGLAEIEKVTPALVRKALAECQDELAALTRTMGRPTTSARQLAILEADAKALESRMDKLDKLTSPYEEQLELAAAHYRDQIEQLAEARHALDLTCHRAKGAALARLFSRVVVSPLEPGQARTDRRLTFGLAWDNAKLVLRIGADGKAVPSVELVPECRRLSLSVHGDPWAENRFRDDL